MHYKFIIRLIVIVIFAGFSLSVIADDTNVSDKTNKNVKSKTESVKQEPPTNTLTFTTKLEQKPGLPEYTKDSLESLYLINKIDTIKNIDDVKLVLPDDLIEPVFGKIAYASKTYYFAMTREKSGGKFAKLYFDRNADMNLKDETPVKCYYNSTVTDTVNEEVYFHLINIPVGESKVSVFIHYSIRENTKVSTNQLITNEYFKYTVCQQFEGIFKFQEKEYKFTVVDQMADRKLELDKPDYDLWFIDVNRDGKYEFETNSPECVSSTEFMIGKQFFNVKFDLEKMKAEFTVVKPQFGKILLKIEEAEDACVYVTKSTSLWGQQYKVEFKDGIGYAPIGKLLLRQLEFTKNGKRNKLIYKTFSSNESVEISTDKPYELNIDLVFKIKVYDNGVKNLKQRYVIMGYVYDRRRDKDTECLTQVHLYQDEKEVRPCEFTIKNSDGNEISKGLCIYIKGEFIYEFKVEADEIDKYSVEIKYDYAPFMVEYTPVFFEKK